MSAEEQSSSSGSAALTWRLRVILLRAGGVFGVLGVWVALLEFDVVPSLILPGPLVVAEVAFGLLLTGGAWGAILVTTATISGAFLVAAVLGLLSSFLLSRHTIVASGAIPIFAWGYVFPIALLFPLFILWFGVGPASKVAYGAANAFFPIAFTTLKALSAVPKLHSDIGRAFGASKSQIDWHIKRGSAQPLILSGLRIGAGMASVSVVLGEVLGSGRGLGYEIQRAVNLFQIAESYGYIVITIIVTSLLLFALESALKSDRYESNG